MLSLRRVATGDYGTLGILWVNNLPWCLTLEPSDPIPTGTYPLSVYNSPKNGFPVYLLSGVPGHDYIEIHPGNTYNDTLGCILVGQGIDTWSGVVAIINSRFKFNQLMQMPIHEAIKIS